MNKLDDQLLYDLTLKSSFSVKDSEQSPYTIVINGWAEKLAYFVNQQLGRHGENQSTKHLPLKSHAWKYGEHRYIAAFTRFAGVVFSDENGFQEPIWKFDLDFDNSPVEGTFFFLSLADFGNSALIIDGDSYQSYLLDVGSKRLGEIALDLPSNGKIVSIWNLPENYINEKALFVLCSFGDWNILSLSSMQSLLAGKIENCPILISAIFLPKYWTFVGTYSPNGVNIDQLEPGESGRSVCFVSFRITSDAPYVITEGTDHGSTRSNLMSRLLWFRKSQVDPAVSMIVSPSQSNICVLHKSGLLSIWSCPSLKLKHVFSTNEQRTFPMEGENIPATATKEISQVKWWSDDYLALLFKDGAFTINRTTDLSNAIGGCAEWFDTSSMFSLIFEDAAYILEKQPEMDSSQSVAVVQPTGYMSVLRNMFSMFVPKFSVDGPISPPHQETVTNLELWSFQRVTPEELFEIKIENEEYGDALLLARAYNFDADLIYLRRWNKASVSHASIQDYLGKIENKRTAINECITRIAETMEGQRELLEFGKRLTDPTVILKDIQDGNLQEFLVSASTKAAEVLASLENSHTEIFLWHFRILEFMKRLQLYEDFLVNNSTLLYDSCIYGHIRDFDIFELAIEAARSGDVKLLELIFAYYLSALDPYRLVIISNLPETLSPSEYNLLLPGRIIKRTKTDYDDILNTRFTQLLMTDHAVYEPAFIEAVLLVELPNLEKFVPKFDENGQLSEVVLSEIYSQWYLERAEEIEQDSWNFDHALQLLGFGKDIGVAGLDDLYLDFKILSLLVYSCGLRTFSLQALRDSQIEEILKFMLANSRKMQPSTSMLEKHIKLWFQPYADLLEQKNRSTISFETIFVKFLTDVVKDDLDFVVTVLKLCSRKECNLLISPMSLMTAAVDSIFNCNMPGSVPLFEEILSYMPARTSADDITVLKKLNEIDRIKTLIDDLKILAKYDISYNVSEIRDITDSSDRSRELLNHLMVHILRTVTKDRNSNFFWNCVLADGLKLVDSFNCQDITKEDWLAIYARHLLMQGNATSRFGKLIEGTNFVNVAKTVLIFSQSQVSERHVNTTLTLSYAKSARLAVDVARELFESATDLDDSSLTRSKACLELISKQYVEIDDELGRSYNQMQCYLECCELMKKLEAPIVPLALEVTGDRLGLLANVVSASPETSIKHTSVFLKLAEFLEIGENITESRNLGLKLLADSAIKIGNLDSALSYCEKIVAADFAMAWQECAKLCELRVGMTEESGALTDPSRLFPLLVFSLSHCDSPSQMRLLVSIRQRILADHCTISLQPPAEELAGKVVGTVVSKVAQEIGGRTIKASSMLFRDQFNPIVSLISSTLPDQKLKSSTSYQEVNHHLDAFSSTDVSLIKKFVRSFEPASDIALMLRLACLSSSERPPGVDNTELNRQILHICKKIVPDYIEEDLAFVIVTCLCSALASGDSGIISSMLNALSPEQWPPLDPKIGVLSIYIISLYLGSVELGKENPLREAPVSIISEVYAKLSDESSGEEFMQKTKPLGERFLTVISMLFKLDESQSVSNKLPPDVDVELFINDYAYRKEAILSSANENFEQAIELAERYEISAEVVRFCFARKALLEGPIDDDLLFKVADTLKPLLNEDSSCEKVRAFLKDEVFPKIGGYKHKRVEFFFKIVQSLADHDSELVENFPMNSISISAILSSNETCFSSLNFYEITSQPSDSTMLNLLENSVDDSSLNQFVRLVKLLPETSMSASSIYCRWAVDKFLMALSMQTPITINTLSEALASVESYFIHLTPTDFSNFMFDTYSSKLFVKTNSVPSSAKQQFLKTLLQALKTFKAKQAKMRARSTASPTDWSPAQEAFRLIARHLDRLNSKTWLELELVIDSSIYDEIREDFDRTVSKEPALTSFVSYWLSRLPVANSDYGPEVIELFLGCVDFKEKSVPEALALAFRHQLSNNADPSPLVLAVNRWFKIPGKSELVKDIFSSFRETVFAVIVHGESHSTNLTPQQRIQLLHKIMEASGGQLNLSRDMLLDADFLLLQVRASLPSKGTNISRGDLESEASRVNLLIRMKDEGFQWTGLLETIKVLPAFEDPLTQSQIIMPILKEAATSASSSQDKMREMTTYSCLIREMFTDKRINVQQLMEIADHVYNLSFPQQAIIICLISSLARDSPAIYNYISAIEPSVMNMRHQLLCSELLEAGMLSKFARTSYFVPLVDYALNFQSSLTFSVDQLIDQLASFGLDEEVDFVRRRISARNRFAASDIGESEEGSSFLGSVSGALKGWF